jgi:iron complex outermembrane receptor protein
MSKYLELDTQNFYGYGAWPIVQDPKNLKHSSWVNELRYTPKISQTLDLDMKLGYKEYGFGGDSRIAPYSVFIPTSSDLIAGGVYKEKTLYTDLAANYNYDMHALTLGTYIAKTSVRNPTYTQNALLPIFAPIPSDEQSIDIPEGGLKNRVDRTQYALYVSDVITLSREWMANIGLRYDDYSDIDYALSPKLSLLYAYDERQSYKLMYQNSFRAPTFVELYGKVAPFIGDENLNSETIDTLEFAYSFEQSYERWININFFYSQMRNFIYRDPAFRLKNGLDASSYGGEFEFKTPLFDKTSLQTNYSYVHSQDKEGFQTPLIANHLANLLLSYQLNKDWHTGSRLRYVGERKREALDSREPLDAYATFDQTVTFAYDDFLFQASVKNLFDADVRYVAPIGNGVTSGTYVDDLERNGRVFWLSAQWMFK